MDTLTPQSLKKLLIGLGVSLLIIIIFLVLKLFLGGQERLTPQEWNRTKSTQQPLKAPKQKAPLRLLDEQSP